MFKLPFAVLVASSALAVQADVRLASIFGDHMVLQRGVSIPLWGKADPGEKITVTLGLSTRDTIAGPDGKWMLRFDPLQAGGPIDMAVTGSNVILVKDIYTGEVWLGSGQSNMDMTVAAEDRYWCGVMNEEEEIASANYPEVRMFKVKLHMTDAPQTELQGQWMVTTPETVKKYSATGYFFARELHRKLRVPIGFIDSSYGASTAQAWISPEALERNRDFAYLREAYEKSKVDWAAQSDGKKQKYDLAMKAWAHSAAKAASEGNFLPKEPGLGDPARNQHNPSVLFNGMIAPLIPYPIRGFVWYQGESNEDASVKIYRQLMETLIGDWRQRWGAEDLPFLYVQLASLGVLSLHPASKAPIAALREAQLQNLRVPHTGMAVTIDIGDAGNIHPKNKQDVGRRLALIARALAYHEAIPYSGPLYDSMKVDGQAIRIRFKAAESGLVAKGGTAIGFAIAGEDRKFVWANAKVQGDTAIVSSPEVAAPVAVRYGWADNPPVNLYNKAGLPASPFRTEEW